MPCVSVVILSRRVGVLIPSLALTLSELSYLVYQLLCLSQCVGDYFVSELLLRFDPTVFRSFHTFCLGCYFWPSERKLAHDVSHRWTDLSARPVHLE